nr:autotransporter domain-containing protein [uncultured Hyphomonas sp.]
MSKFTKARAFSHASTTSACLFSGFVALTLIAPSASAQANTNAGSGNYYFFGDSNIGQGNFSAIVGSRYEDFYPNSSNNGFERDSNGLIWAELLGRDVDIILDPDIDSPNINFAISGAHMTRGGDLVPFGVETGVRVQTEEFAALVESDALSIGNNDVAFMIAGANDFLDRLEIDDPADEIVADVAAAAAENIAALANSGVKTIILSEIQPLRFAPQFSGDPETQDALAQLIEAANAEMFAAVAELDLPSDVNVVTMRYEAFMTYVTSNAAALGFTDTTSPCFDWSDTSLCSTDFNEQNKYLWFDPLHMTEAGHALVAQWWMATLAGANGSASLETARLPRVGYEQLESHLRLVRPGAYTTSEDHFAAWLAPASSSLDISRRGASPKASLDLDGASLGMEGRFAEHFVVGGALSVGKTDVVFDTSGSARLEGGMLSVYGALDYQADGRLSLTMTRGGHEVTGISRATGVTLLSAQGETDSELWDVEVAARSVDRIGAVEIDHGMALSAGRIKVDGYEETGANGLALSYGDQAFNYRRLMLDAKFRGPDLQLSRLFSVTPLADVAYVNQFGDDDYGLTSSLIDNTSMPVTIRSEAPTEDRFNAGVGARLGIGENWSLTARYAHQWAEDIDRSDEFAVTLHTVF